MTLRYKKPLPVSKDDNGVLGILVIKLLPLPTPKPFSKNKNYVKTTYYHRNITRHVGGFSGV
jgi:hypothetical protein